MATFQSTTGAPAEIRKPKIYISCRTPLQEADRNSIIEAVLACRNCDIFWFEDAVSNQERKKLLADMQLILLPVDLAVLTVSFGFVMKMSVAQVICIAIALFAYKRWIHGAKF